MYKYLTHRIYVIPIYCTPIILEMYKSYCLGNMVLHRLSTINRLLTLKACIHCKQISVFHYTNRSFIPSCEYLKFCGCSRLKIRLNISRIKIGNAHQETRTSKCPKTFETKTILYGENITLIRKIFF